MKLKEAIKRVKVIERDYPALVPFDDLKALKLLIEAGKRVEKHRQGKIITEHALLPGETKE